MRDPTEGVLYSQMRMPFLRRNLPARLDEEEEYNRYYGPLEHQDGLIIRICANSYHLLYEPGSTEWNFRPPGRSGHQADEAVKERRRDRFTEKFVNNPVWARGLSKSQVDESNQRFRSWVNGEPGPSEPGDAGDGDGDIGDAGAKTTEEKDEEPAPGAAPAPETESHEPEPEDTDMADAEPTETGEEVGDQAKDETKEAATQES